MNWNLRRSTIILSIIAVSSQKNFEGHVVGGKYTDIRHVPHSAYLVVTCKDEWICGSSILTQRVILTAAHCLYCQNYKKIKVLVYAGHENIEKVKVTTRIKKFYVHERYDDVDVINDVAIGIMFNPLPLGPNIKRVMLLARPSVKPGDIATVAGWGVVDNSQTQTLKLKLAKVTVRAGSSCETLGPLESGMFCAGSLHPTADRPAEGDSGSALIMDNYQQIGLVSFKVNNYPALQVYTNVSYYYTWIRRNSIKLVCQ